MRYKATFVAGFGLGYLLGGKAGRARYEQIMKSIRGFLGTPVVQETASAIQHEAIDLVHTAKDKVSRKVGGQELTNGFTPVTPEMLSRGT